MGNGSTGRGAACPLGKVGVPGVSVVVGWGVERGWVVVYNE